ncbi:MAG: hypothetical protein A2289_19270 [Deltaproteobacteria bacterium RIFOXYA12_FULL_58_15]|nr:MAG: hypothetical protein A2289_19270 [Deltaproteobacteria bacterium RIFOXYA12_FULL_58_15]
MRKFLLQFRLTLTAVMFTAAIAEAQSVPAGVQEYYVIGDAEQIYEMIQAMVGGGNGGCNTTTTLTATTDIQTVIYDHWEDGYDPNPYSTATKQTTTLIIGDGDASNGCACDFTSSTTDTDDVISLDEALSWKSRGAGTTAITDYVPYPRNATTPQLRYDGRDRIIVVGGPVNLVHAIDPRSQYIGDAMGMLPRQLMGNHTSYVVPMGADLHDFDHYHPFDYVYLMLLSYDDNVTVNVDNRQGQADSTVSFQLSTGDTWSSLGKINLTAAPASAISIRSGTKVTASGPVAALVITGGSGTYQSRFYSLLPESLFSNDYVIPVHGDRPNVNGDHPQNIYIYNPDPVNNLNVQVYDTTHNGTNMVVLPQKLMAYTQWNPIGPNDPVPQQSTVRLVADRHFWGVGAIDYQATSHDWGYSFVPTSLLTDTIGVSWAPGNRFDPTTLDSENGSPVWISPLMDNTTIKVDWDANGVYDNTYTVDTLSALRLYDTSDRDQTGMRVWGSNKFVAAYGQDPDVASASGDVLDLGYEIMPQDFRFLEQVLSVEATSDKYNVPQTGAPSSDPVTITLYLRTGLSSPAQVVSDLAASFTLPTNWSYEAGSTLVNFASSNTDTADPSFSVGTLAWDWSSLGETMTGTQLTTLQFEITIAGGAGTDDRYDFEATATGTYDSRPYNPRDDLTIIKSPLDITLTVGNVERSGSSSARPGEHLIYTSTVTNDSASTVNADIRIPVPFDTTWSDLHGGTYDGACNCAIYSVTLDPAGGASDSLSVQLEVLLSDDAAVGGSISNQARADVGLATELISAPAVMDIDAPVLAATLSGPSVAGPGCPFTYNVRVTNTGNENATGIAVDMPIPSYTSYVAGTMTLDVNDTATTNSLSCTDASGGDCSFTTGPDTVSVLLTSQPLVPNGYLIFTFQVDVTGTASDNIAAVATTRAAQLPPAPFVITSNVVDTDIDDSGDSDGDGLINGICSDVAASCTISTTSEGCLGTNPYDADSDDDGYRDGDELAADPYPGVLRPAITNPLDWDSDNDGLPDGLEVGVFSAGSDTDTSAGHFASDTDVGATTTDPNDPDTDGGGVLDGAEDTNRNGTFDSADVGDPNEWNDDDADADGLTNVEEDSNANHTFDSGVQNETDWNDADSDDDGILDGDEGNNPGDWALDTDSDGWINARDPDSDDDGIYDGTEVGLCGVPHADTTESAGFYVEDADCGVTYTDMLDSDSDGDNLDDGTEDSGFGDGRDYNGRYDGEPETMAHSADTDNDGSNDDVDCSPWNSAIYQGATETCNGVNDDCDTEFDENFDSDNDTYTTCGTLTTTGASVAADCNDGVAAIYPGAGEACNGFDDDCDTEFDEDFDSDNDTYTTCGTLTTTGTTANIDCDDTDLTSNPAALTELCDGNDNDCDGATPAEEIDNDSDTYVECMGWHDSQGDHDAITGSGDCNDSNAAINPAATEICDAIDNNCNTSTDEGFDGDVDGVTVCGPDGIDGSPDDDCDDFDEFTNPTLPELCDGNDNNCDTVVPTDETDDDGDAIVECSVWHDTQGDNPEILAGGDCNDANDFVNPNVAEIECNAVNDDCNSATVDDPNSADDDDDGYTVECNHDCDDTNFFIHPNAEEHCDDTVDNNCDTLTDEEDTVACVPDCPDLDGDGYRDPSCGGTDCDDSNPSIKPDAGEDCTDGIDNDCNGRADTSDPLCPPGCADVDGDGYENRICGGSDCDDDRRDIHPAQAESCTDEVDNDCDGLVDFADAFECVADCDDADGDTFLDQACGGTDCDDTNQFINRNAAEDCFDGRDNNCDGAVDGDDNECSADCPDADDDKFRDHVCGGTDCDDTTAFVSPGLIENCADGVDNNCDDLTDAEDVIACPAGCADADADDYPDANCGGTDCNDNSNVVNPNAHENCFNSIDDNCDGLIDFEDTLSCPASCIDADVDGFLDVACGGDDCDDANPHVNPNAAEHCSNTTDDNCDGLVDGEDPADCPAGCDDDDGDGYRASTCGGTDCNDDEDAVNPNANEIDCDTTDNDCNPLTPDLPDHDRDDSVADSCSGLDCNDLDPLINQDAGENCEDTLDNNCDGFTDADDALCPFGCPDLDGDEYFDQACNGSDCDDANPIVNPGTGEHCSDRIDNDCDTLTDDEDIGDCPPGCVDFDADGFPSALCGGTDCNDGSFDVNPVAGEHCDDDVDNDCNGLVDWDDPASCPTGCADADGDHYLDAECGGSDCNDQNAGIHQGAGEHCFDDVDNNCDGRVDANDPFCPAGCADADGDGYEDAACGGSDCDDSEDAVNPGRVELCIDAVDNNCNGDVDFTDPACPPGCDDGDGDGYLDAACGGQDCNDTNSWIFPGGGEHCENGADDNCNGAVDEEDAFCPPECDDNDGDGYVDAVCGGSDCNDSAAATHPAAGEHCSDSVDNDCDLLVDDEDVVDCPADCISTDVDFDGYPGWICGGTDCNDTDSDINPGEVESVCNGIDEDCNPATPDDMFPSDADLDGFTIGCGGDCDDDNAFVNYSAAERCDDGLDNDCNNVADSEDAACPPDCADADGDGFRDVACGGTDCDDQNYSVNPSGGEHCGDGIDNDCDDLVDGSDPGCNPSCADVDLDFYHDSACGGSDCDDTSAAVHPGMGEHCGDGIDNDCNGLIDEDDVGGCPFGCADRDGDGYRDTECGGSDCDDNLNAVYAGAPELCDGFDNDCDGVFDEGFVDVDGDGVADCIDEDLNGDGWRDDVGISGGGCTCGATTSGASGGTSWLLMLILLWFLPARRRSRR